MVMSSPNSSLLRQTSWKTLLTWRFAYMKDHRLTSVMFALVATTAFTRMLYVENFVTSLATSSQEKP